MRADELTRVAGQVPKVINPGMHAVLDYLTAGAFIAAGGAMLRRHPRAAGLAFVNGAAVLGLALLTDYPGGVFRKVSFKTHAAIDALQAAMSASGPAVLGFARDGEAQLFHLQAVIEAAVMAATDFGAATRADRAAA